MKKSARARRRLGRVYEKLVRSATTRFQLEPLEPRVLLSGDTLATATPLDFLTHELENGAIYKAGFIDTEPIVSSGDVDYWSFEALSGDLVSISVESPDGILNPRVSLRNSADGNEETDNDDGPGSAAFVSRFQISSSGTYFARVDSQNGSVGDYGLRVDVVRGLDLESDARYANDSAVGQALTLAGNLTLIVILADRGEPGSSDAIGITLWKDNELWFSSRWTGATTVQQLLAGGNLQVHIGKSDSTAALKAAEAVRLESVGTEDALSDDALAPVVEGVIYPWTEAAMRAAAGLERASVLRPEITKLPDSTLGQLSQDVIRIDTTPAAQAKSEGPVFGAMDLLSVVTHELDPVQGPDAHGLLGATSDTGLRAEPGTSPAPDDAAATKAALASTIDAAMPSGYAIRVLATESRPEDDETEKYAIKEIRFESEAVL